MLYFIISSMFLFNLYFSELNCNWGSLKGWNIVSKMKMSLNYWCISYLIYQGCFQKTTNIYIYYNLVILLAYIFKFYIYNKLINMCTTKFMDKIYISTELILFETFLENFLNKLFYNKNTLLHPKCNVYFENYL